eukprot:gnl/Chilomastix_cuspidata/10891.p1 GENE.gnl/Chilomastix_cuspidata/10891~~gnl/Chilomastix_cuspidata/10891.p1  ORF type:complete len:140 (-),score=5.45 gnl/Chilomastix_cuspidata/10891:265-684(-)
MLLFPLSQKTSPCIKSGLPFTSSRIFPSFSGLLKQFIFAPPMEVMKLSKYVSFASFLEPSVLSMTLFTQNFGSSTPKRLSFSFPVTSNSLSSRTMTSPLSIAKKSLVSCTRFTFVIKQYPQAFSKEDFPLLPLLFQKSF